MGSKNTCFCPGAGAEGIDLKLMASFDLLGKEVTVRILLADRSLQFLQL